MRLVIDSNVWISSLVFGGKPRYIFERAVADGWTIVVSEEIFTEIRRVLATKFTDFADDFESFQAILWPRIMMVRLGQVRVAVSRDEDDNRVIETALIGEAACIVTGDKDLLVLSNFNNIAILTPADFISSLV